MPFGPLQNPHILVLMTDQQRSIQHFPADWTTANLPHLRRLSKHGVTFRNAITNTGRCTPVRGLLWTGLYPPRNGVTEVSGGPEGTLDDRLQTLGKILAGAGYEVAYKGKWHLTPEFGCEAERRPNLPRQLSAENRLMRAAYGMPAWDAPDAGNRLSWYADDPPEDSSINTLGGGPTSPTRNDARYADDAIDFLQAFDPAGGRPFFLVVSLVNPHDVWAHMYADLMHEAFSEYPAAMDALPHAERFRRELLPPSYEGDSLRGKPWIQTRIRDDYTRTFADHHEAFPPSCKLGHEHALDYLKFYAYLNHLVDVQLDRIHAALRTRGLVENTVIVRLSDHGELAMSHGGMMEKDCNVYRETINVPLIFSNPILWPTPVSTDALIGLVDLAPTLAAIAGAAPSAGSLGRTLQGRDFSAYLLNPEGPPPQDAVLFTYDDGYPVHIRALRTAPGAAGLAADDPPWKYAVYYELSDDNQVDLESLQFELYDLAADVDEMVNLLPANGKADRRALKVQRALHRKLTALMQHVDAKQTPVSLSNPLSPDVTPRGWRRATRAVGK